MNESWLRNADRAALVDALAAARAWADDDLEARTAASLLEERLSLGTPSASSGVGPPRPPAPR